MNSLLKKQCMIIGDPVDHSLSPAMHNAAYKKLGIDNIFSFTKRKVTPNELESLIDEVRENNIRGLTCTIPHKVEVMKYLDEIDLIAKKIGAVNTVVNEGGLLKGYNTDWLGTVTPLENLLGKGGLKGKKVALIGAGGAARAMAFGVIQKGAKLKIYNRTVSKAKALADELLAEAAGLGDLEKVCDADIIINSTSIGMGDKKNISPIPAKFISKSQIVFDAVYVPYETKLLKDAESKRATIIHGIEMLLYQGTAQFELYTNQTALQDVMRQSLLDHFRINATT